MPTFFPTALQGTRQEGSYVGGVWQVTAVPFEFEGSVQPMKGKDFDALPIARVDSGSMKLYTATKLNVSKEGNTQGGDLLVWDGRRWEVTNELTNQNGLIAHYKYIISERGAA